MRTLVKRISFLRSNRLLKDPRNFQVLFLASFLAYGVQFLGWDAEILGFSIIIGTGLAVQALGIAFTTKNFSGLKSSLITSLSLCILLKSNDLWVLALGAAIAIGSKFLVRWNGKHVFNPSNIGIVIALLFTGRAWISPGQWGHETVLFFGIGFLSLVMLLQVGRLDMTLTFLGTLFVLSLTRNVFYMGWEMDVVWHQFSNGSVLLFSMFMITDPKTTPNHRLGRIIYAMFIAVLSFIGGAWFHFYTAPMFVLACISPLVFILDRFFKAQKFEWAT